MSENERPKRYEWLTEDGLNNSKRLFRVIATVYNLTEPLALVEYFNGPTGKEDPK
jgi:hypothetical protein